MNAAEILEEVRSHGAELFLREGKLVVRGSGAALPESLQAEIKGNKAELMIALGSPVEPTIASILADIRPYLPDAIKRLPDGSLLILINWSMVHGGTRLPSSYRMAAGMSEVIVENRTSSLFCPQCASTTRKSEWAVLLRRVQSATGLRPVRVMRHRRCNEIAYFLLK